MLLFQSLLDARPQSASNSLGVYQEEPNLIHLPRPPEPNRLLWSSADVFLHLTGKIGKLAASFQEYVGPETVTGVALLPSETSP